MKKIVLMAALFGFVQASGQVKVSPADTVKISGNIRHPLTLPLAALDTFRQTTVGDVVMTDGQGKPKETARGVKGILLKDLLSSVEPDVPNRKGLNRLFLVFTATDGFKWVLSWNEAVHGEDCLNYYLLTEKDGKKIGRLEERVEILSVTAAKTGHNRIKGLYSISVRSAE